jgi:hypothetical protein
LVSAIASKSALWVRGLARLISSAQAASQGPGQERLARAGNILEQQVPLGDQADPRQPHKFGLAQKDSADGTDRFAQKRQIGSVADRGR